MTAWRTRCHAINFARMRHHYARDALPLFLGRIDNACAGPPPTGRQRRPG